MTATDHTFLITFFGALLAIMNPVAGLPIFLSVTNGAPAPIQRRIAVKSALYSLIMGVAIIFAGRPILTLFGISVDDFRIAGGLVLMLIALNMLNGAQSASHTGSSREKAEYPAPDTVAFYPLAFPMIVGPGTITTLIVFAHKAQGTAELAILTGVFAVMVAGLGLSFYFAPLLARYLSQTAQVIMSRLMGMILAAIAVSMLTEGLRALFPGLS